MLHTEFQASKPSGSEEKDVLNVFYVFKWHESRTPLPVAILDPGTFFWTNVVVVH